MSGTVRLLRNTLVETRENLIDGLVTALLASLANENSGIRGVRFSFLAGVLQGRIFFAKCQNMRSQDPIFREKFSSLFSASQREDRRDGTNLRIFGLLAQVELDSPGPVG